ncbi:outer membrane protein assembly factor BamC [Aquabacterium sp.]|uniref:outer membrane protein assembly factor BamC n=1 Tax=Aquabacterium sp. TaxID=1872578 RepID=UPI00378319BF
MNRVFVVTPTRAAALALVALLAGCSSLENTISDDKVNYRSQAAKTEPLEVPPDLTQLARDTRYQPQAGVISATAMQQGGAGPAVAVPAVAVNQAGDFRIERQGNQRWIVSTLPPERIYQQIRNFWLERGFTLTLDNAEIGMMETDWAENRARLPQDPVRNLLGKVLDGFFSTSERDRFRTRIDRSGTGSEIFVSHRGLVEVVTGDRRDSTAWQPRPSDPQLEAEMLSRLLLRLGAKEEVARSVVAAGPTGAAAAGPAAQPRARLLADQPGAALQVDEAFDRAWRRVGLALDRSGFTVEDRDRSAGLYYVRYVDPKLAGKDEPGFFAKLFGTDKSQALVQRYRLQVKATGDKTTVVVLNNQGSADKGEHANAIVTRLLEELK